MYVQSSEKVEKFIGTIESGENTIPDTLLTGLI
jgi:hypothetical protein